MSFRKRNRRREDPFAQPHPRPGGEGGNGGDRDAERREGRWRGRQIARVFRSPDDYIVLVGKAAQDNDVLSIKMARPYDLWFHVAGMPGSHVLVLNDDKLDRLPRSTIEYAAGLAAGYSKARAGGRVAVHQAVAGDVSKPRGAEAGKVALRRFTALKVEPRRE